MTDPRCLARSALGYVRAFLYGQPRVSGHSYVETETHEGCTVQVSTCECCGAVTVGWWITAHPPEVWK